MFRRADILVRSKRRIGMDVKIGGIIGGVAADKNVRAPFWLQLCRVADEV